MSCWGPSSLHLPVSLPLRSLIHLLQTEQHVLLLPPLLLLSLMHFPTCMWLAMMKALLLQVVELSLSAWASALLLWSLGPWLMFVRGGVRAGCLGAYRSFHTAQFSEQNMSTLPLDVWGKAPNHLALYQHSWKVWWQPVTGDWLPLDMIYFCDRMGGFWNVSGEHATKVFFFSSPHIRLALKMSHDEEYEFMTHHILMMKLHSLFSISLIVGSFLRYSGFSVCGWHFLI